MKIKSHLQREEEKKFKRDFDYEEWLRDFIGVPSAKDLDLIEKQFSSNNPNYQPFKGA